MTYEFKPFHRRNLPHIHWAGSTFFVTFRLAGSISQTVLRQWKADRMLVEREIRWLDTRAERNDDVEKLTRAFHRKWFARYEDILHKAGHGPIWLKDREIAAIVADSLRQLDGNKYALHCFCIMCNHVHVLFTPFVTTDSITTTKQIDGRRTFESGDATVSAIMQSIKGYTAREANRLLGRRGQFWQAESYDRRVRDEAEFRRILIYILNNPVKAGLVRDWRLWSWSYVAPDARDRYFADAPQAGKPALR